MMVFNFLLFFLLFGSTLSCSCVLPSTLKEDFDRTSIIFIGRVIKKVPPISSFQPFEYTVQVEEAFKVKLYKIFVFCIK